MRLLKSTMGPLGLCKPPWHFERCTLCPDFSLRTKTITPGKKESVTTWEQLCSWTEVLAQEGEREKHREEQARSYSLPSTVHSRDNICRASSGWSAGHRCWTYPTCPTEESLHLHLLHQYYGKAWVEKDWAYGKGGFRDISGQAFKARFLAPFPHVSMRTTMNSQPSWSVPEPTQENPRRRVSVPDSF